jgi:hypothetical protein
LGILLLAPLAITQEVPLKELLNPDSIHVSREMIFITQGAEILCYRRKNLQFLRKFGTRGQGPGEFDISPIDNLGLRLFFKGNKLLVNSWKKISYYTRQGKLINEKRIQFPMAYFMIVGDKYVASEIGVMPGEQNRRSITVNLYNKNFKKEVKLQEIPHYVQVKKSVDPIALVLALKNQTHRGLFFQATEDKIFVENNQRNKINVFNLTGNRISTISYAFEKIKISETFKNDVISYLKKRLPNAFRNIRNIIKFPDHFPVIRSFFISDQKLYVRIHQSSPDTGLFYLFSLSGKFIKCTSVLLKEVSVLRTYPYTIDGNKIYQLIEDDEENWRLKVTSL